MISIFNVCVIEALVVSFAHECVVGALTLLPNVPSELISSRNTSLFLPSFEPPMILPSVLDR